MGRRRDLRGIVGNLLSSFVSRNNDLDGYWALGLLKAAVEREPTPKISLDLLTASAQPKTTAAEQVAKSYGRWLARELRNHELSVGLLQEANITVEFGSFHGSAPPSQVMRGEPYICAVRIVDDHGKIYQRAASGWCDIHDAARELRRRPGQRGVAV